MPLAVAPAQAADNQVAARVTVDGSPEEDVAGAAFAVLLPLFGNEMRMGEEVVENVRVQNRLPSQFLAEFVALDGLAILLQIREVEPHLLGVPLEKTTLLMILHPPSLGDERVGVAVDHVILRHHFTVTREETLKSLLSADLVHERFDLTEGKIAVLHRHAFLG